MGRHSNASAPVPTSSDRIRNVVLVGPSGSGKTRLFDHLIGITNPGYRPPQRGDDRSTSLSIASLESNGVVVNLLDAPGYPDFVGELRAGLRAADAALFVVSAADGVDTATAALWRECAAVDMPRAVVMTKLDAQNADFDATVDDCQNAFGDGVQPLSVPIVGKNGSLDSIIDLVLGEVHDYSGAERTVQPTAEEHIPLFEQYQGPLLEGIIQEAEDDSLLDRYLEGEEIGFEILETALLTAMARGSFHPVLPVSVDTGAGINVVLHLVEAAFPAPTQVRQPSLYTPQGAPADPLEISADGPLLAHVIRTTTDAYVGHIALVRVFSGTLRADETVRVSGHLSHFVEHPVAGHEDHDDDVRVGQLASPLDEDLRSKDKAIAGDLCIVQKLPAAQTSDTISSIDNPLVIAPWDMPEALLPAAIEAASRNDEDKLPGALQRLAGTDPSLRVEHNSETSQIVLWTMGQTHLDLVLEKLRALGVEVTNVPLKIALRETFLASSTARGRHVKQSGGHGQYAVCDITVDPLPRGSGFEFVDKVVGGAVPRQFIPSVEKGVRAQLERGVVAGYPMVDVRVTLFDGKAHSVDSSDAAFQMAGGLGLKEAAARGKTGLLEPIDLLNVTVEDEFVGAVMTDVSGRRGRILGSEPAEIEGLTVIKAEVPQLELSRYAIDLRSMSRGTGAFTRERLGYEQMPQRLAEDFIANA